MRASLKWMCAAVGVLLFGILILFFLSWRSFRDDDKITASNFRLIKPGMTRKEVEVILGGPSNSEWQLPRHYAFGPGENAFCPSWYGKIGTIWIIFDNGKVVETGHDGRDEHPDFMDRFWSWFGLSNRQIDGS